MKHLVLHLIFFQYEEVDAEKLQMILNDTILKGLAFSEITVACFFSLFFSF